MSTKFIDKCPACGADMYLSTLKCSKCGIEIKGDFEMPNGNSSFNLSQDEFDFLKVFLKHEGNFTKVQEELNIGYFAVKSKIKDINVKLGNEEKYDMDDYKNNIDSNGKGKVSQRIIELLNANGGKAECPMLKGEPLTIWLTSDGVKNSGFTNFVCEWDIFDAIVDKARELGGTMYRGDGAAQSGAKIGSKELPLDTIDSFISIEFYGNYEGNSTLRRSTYYAAILAWAGICQNKRSRGEGGFIVLNPEWR